MIVLLVVAGIVSGLFYLAVQAAKYFIGYFMPKTADRVDAWREESFVRKTAQAILDGQGYTAWAIQRHVERHAPKLLPRPEHETTYGIMKGHPEALELDRIAAADRHTRIVAAVNAKTKEGFANRGA